MIVSVDTRSAVPPYEQLRGQMETLVRSGVLQSGDQLPTIRQLAADLGLAVGTVARAYRELEAADLIESHRRRGTFVTQQRDQKRELSSSERSRLLEEAARTFAQAALQLGVNPEVAVRQVSRLLAAGCPR